jgi:opacity protein-like surface antigen
MNYRLVALAGASLLAFTLAAAAQESGGATSGGATSSAPAAPPMQPPPPPPPMAPPPPAPAPMAEMMTQGWYAGLGAGFDHLDNLKIDSPLGTGTVKTNDSALVTGSWGYRFPDRFRVEGEIGWDQHGFGSGVGGHASLWSFLLNGAYDFKLGPRWDYTVGAGAGIGELGINTSGVSESNQGFMWQAFTGFDYWVCHNMSVNLDARYREVSVNDHYDAFGIPFQVKAAHERALMLSVRWYPWAQ